MPTQALFLMNSPVVKKHAQDLTHWLEKNVTKNAARLDLLWLSTLNRPITAEEKHDAEAFLAKDANNGWIELCHAVLASNEFLMRM